MKQWISGAVGFGTMLFALFALAQWPAQAGAGQDISSTHAQQAAAAAAPAHLHWMLEQHWRAVNGQMR